MRESTLTFLLCLLLLSCAGSPKEAPDPAKSPDKGTAAAETQSETKSVKPGINKRFKDPNMDVAKAKKTFEGESREVFVHKVKIAKTVPLVEGEAIADIGAGTGIFLPFFTKGVGAKGKVFAVEISPRFIDHIQALSKKKNWSQVETVFCTDKSTKLDAGSIDAAFICDTYHHFEYPQSTLASLHQAMKPGGRLVIVDFERIPGTSRKWILGHVRCDKQTVIREVTAAGFTYVDEVDLAGLKENYIIRFERR
jgi:ubiquinone/menaquinone biosynthesis C-methylase UbiE